ncbi:reverse transcriptase domain-containing protein [Tanacetum coccineum]
MSLPSLTPPFPEETLYAYLAVSREAVSAVLLTDQNGRQCPVQYVSRTLNEAERNYSPLEKLALSLINMTRRLRRYFEAHPVKVITDQPIKNILSRTEASGKLAKYAVEIGTYKISFIPRNAVKGQVLADFLSDAPDGEREDEYFQSPEVSPGIDDTEAWTLYTDGAASSKGSGAGLILTGPSRVEYAYALWLIFASTNNEAEYEDFLEGIRTSANEDVLLDRGPLQANYVIREIHMGSCGMHVGPRCGVRRQCRQRLKAGQDTGKEIIRFVLEQIICRYGLPRIIVTDNRAQLANGLVERENRSLMEGIKTRLGREKQDGLYEFTECIMGPAPQSSNATTRPLQPNTGVKGYSDRNRCPPGVCGLEGMRQAEWRIKGAGSSGKAPYRLQKVQELALSSANHGGQDSYSEWDAIN